MFQWKGQTYIKPYRKNESNTDKQQEIRSAFSTLANDWKILKGIVQNSWKMYVEGERLMGVNAFIGENVPNRRSGEPIEISKALGEMALENFNAEAGSGAGEISCSFDAPEQGNHVTLFLSKQSGDSEHSVLTKHELGKNPSTPAIISGLESGADYHVHAIVTNAAYDNAETVSESVTGVVTVG